MRRNHLERKLNDGVDVDRPLPSGAVRLGAKTRYDPNVRRIYVASKNARHVAHEKGHWMWDLRLSFAQRRQWAKTFSGHVKRLAPKGRRLLLIKKIRKDGRMAEEAFAVAYAEHKTRGTLVAPLRRALKRVGIRL